jgi:hypothetical protein
MKKIHSLIAATLIAGASSANASILLASDGFTITNASQNNPNSVTNDKGGLGWNGGWKSTLSAASAPQIVSTTTMEGDTALEFSKNADQAAFRQLDASLSGDVLVDFLIQVNGTPDANTFVGLWFGSWTGPSVGLKTDCGTGSCTNDLFARTTGQSGPFIQGSDLVSGQTYHLFAHLYKSKEDGYYDRFDAWMNPSADDMMYLSNPDIQATGSSAITSIDKIGFRTVNIDTGVTVRVDALKVAAVPEPGTLCLMGLATLGMGFLRRRKN